MRKRSIQKTPYLFNSDKILVARTLQTRDTGNPWNAPIVAQKCMNLPKFRITVQKTNAMLWKLWSPCYYVSWSCPVNACALSQKNLGLNRPRNPTRKSGANLALTTTATAKTELQGHVKETVVHKWIRRTMGLGKSLLVWAYTENIFGKPP